MIKIRDTYRIIIYCLVMALLIACQMDNAGHAKRQISLSPCKDFYQEKLESFVEGSKCGKLAVKENPADEHSRSLDIHIVLVPSLTKPKDDPLFIFAGGPGQSASEIAPGMMRILNKIQRNRDIVFVDQRGTGYSAPLDCTAEEPDSFVEMFNPDMAVTITRLKKCLADYENNPKFLVTSIAMDDIDKVRQGLGYEKINLYGGSYGTRAAMVYLRRHQEHVRSVVLDGVAPVNMQLPQSMDRDGKRALNLLFKYCRDNEECNNQFPDLENTYLQLLDRLQKKPVQVELQHFRTGEKATIEITSKDVVAMLRNILYIPQLSALVPLLITQAQQDDYQAFVTVVGQFSSGTKSISLGMHLSVVCNEDIPRIKKEYFSVMKQQDSMSAYSADLYEQACEFWPKIPIDEKYYEPVKSDVPVLIFSGQLDPVTPPSWGESITLQLSHSTHVIMPNVAHGVLPHGCAADLMKNFIDDPINKELDIACVDSIKHSPFFLSLTGYYIYQQGGES